MHPEEATQFYRGLGSRQVRVGMEATGSFRWFQRLLAELAQELLLGDAGAIDGTQPRKQKTDKRDARHLFATACGRSLSGRLATTAGE